MLNTFENKKGITKILVYDSVIDVIQINVIFLHYNQRLEAISDFYRFP